MKRIVTFSIVVLLFVFMIPTKCIMFTDKLEKTKKYMTIVENDELIYTYIHSVSNTPIIEKIIIQNKVFVTKEVKYIDQGGAGMPEFNFGQEQFHVENGTFVISNMNKPYNELALQTEEKYKNQIRIKHKDIVLSDIIGGTKVVKLKIVIRPLGWCFLFKV